MCYNINIAQAMDKLGRLFTLPQERVELDKWRVRKPKPPKLLKQLDTSKAAKTQKLETPDFITFNGMIVRRSGQATIWLNGKNSNELKGFGVDTKTIQNTALPIFLQEISEGENPKITWAKEAIYLKPGQILDTKNRTVMEKYEHETLSAKAVEVTDEVIEKVKPVVVKAKPEKQEESSFLETIKSFWED